MVKSNESVGPWRSWERASMASRRSRVRIPSAPPEVILRLGPSFSTNFYLRLIPIPPETAPTLPCLNGVSLWRREDERRRGTRGGTDCAGFAGVGGGVCGVGAKDKDTISDCAGDCRTGAEFCSRDSEGAIESGSGVSGGVAAAVVQRSLADIVAGVSRKFCKHFYAGWGGGVVFRGVWWVCGDAGWIVRMSEVCWRV